MKTIEDLVAEQSLFRDINPLHRELIAGCGRNKAFQDGQLLMKEGDDANEFFVIRRGKVLLTISTPGRGEAPVETLEAGEIVGLSWLFPPYKVQFDARAIGAVFTISFDGACLRGKCERDPAMGYELMKRFAQIMTSRLQATRLRMLDVYGSPG